MRLLDARFSNHTHTFDRTAHCTAAQLEHMGKNHGRGHIRVPEQLLHGADVVTTGVDDQYAQRSMAGFGAFILGRNMFGPIRGAWPDETWRGWWGDNPPYHAPTYILTHHARPSIELEGGTTFHFVTDGIESALRQARAAAGDKDVKIGGGVDTVRQYLRAGLIDDMHLALAPVVLGQGEALFAGLDLRKLGFRVVERAPTDAATHLVLAR